MRHVRDELGTSMERAARVGWDRMGCDGIVGWVGWGRAGMEWDGMQDDKEWSGVCCRGVGPSDRAPKVKGASAESSSRRDESDNRKGSTEGRDKGSGIGCAGTMAAAVSDPREGGGIPTPFAPGSALRMQASHLCGQYGML